MNGKLLETLDDPANSKVTMDMRDKAEEIIQGFEKVTGRMPRLQKTPGQPAEVLGKHLDKPIKHEEYRSILEKLMFYVT